MSDSVKIKKSIVFVAILVVSLTFTQFQTLPASAQVFSTQKITVPSTDRFGWSVQQLDVGFAVGEPFADSDDSGKVHIFDPIGTPNFDITNPGGSGDNFGYSLNTLGIKLAIGAPGHDSNKGMVHLYDLTNPIIPISIQNPSNTIDERMGEDEMNFLQGDLLVGVSKAENDGSSQAGIIYLFSSSTGLQLGTFDDPNISAGDLFGRSISVDDILIDDIILSGAHGAAGKGQAHVIVSPTALTFPNPNDIGSPQGDKYGWSTEITPTKYIVGAPFAEAGDLEIVTQGRIYLHDRFVPNIGSIASPDIGDASLSKEDQFGYDIAYSNGLILVGAPYDDVVVNGTEYIDAGSVYLFHDDGTHLTTLYNPDPEDNDRFGYSLDIMGDNLLVGAPGDMGNTGAVYIASPSGEFAASLTITATPNPVASGAPLMITYTVKNVGTSDFLAPVEINIVPDPTCSSILGPNILIEFGQISILEVNEEWTFTCEKIAPEITYTESINTGQTSISFSPSGDDADIMTCLDPEFQCSPVLVHISATSMTLDISAVPDTIHTNETSDVTFTVTNTGNEPLLIDSETGIVDQNGNCDPVGNISGVITLVLQFPVDFTCIVAGGILPINITATATALDEDENPVLATDTLIINVLTSIIILDISAEPDPTYDGEDTLVTYTVTNTGNSPVTIDEQTGITEVNQDCTPVAQLPIPTPLQPNDVAIFTCTVTAGILPIDFSGTATALGGNNNEITASDTLTVNVIAPEITLDISSNPNPVNSGSTSLVTYTVTNTGNSPVTIDEQADVTENLNLDCTPVPQDTLPITLQEDEVTIFTCTITAGLLPIDFSGTVTADDENGREISDDAQHTLDVIPNILLSGIIRDFKISHPDFQFKISDDDGIVKIDLGNDDEPLYNGNPFTGTITTTGLVNYNQWYNHVNTVNDCIQHDITLVPSTTNPGYFTYTNSTFFPIDGQLFGNEGNLHNYHFTYQIHATFVYQLGQTITMTGDDDIWVFINDKLALDQGGVLPPRTGTINLGTLGLTPGQTYSFDLFFAERHTVQSNLGITTNIPLIQPIPAQCKAVDAVNDSVFAIQDPNTIPVTNNDVGFSSISTFTQGMHGSVSQLGTSLVYTPTLGFEGIDLFTYSITNTSNSTDTAVVTVITLTDATCPLPLESYNVIIGDDNNNKLRGTNGNDLILGNSGDDKIYGKKGNDCLIGGNGNDKIWGGDGNDTILSGSGNDQVHGQQGDDTMFGGSGDDKIYGSKGNDTIDAGIGNDRVHANQDNDTVLGGDGNDWLGAGIGNDTVNGGTGNDKIFGRPGNDVLNGDVGDDYIHGGQGDDTANGGDNNDKIYGHQGHDILNGDNGNDYIHGGQGNDALDGGDGSDRCNGAQGDNTIVNCEAVDNKMKEEQEENDDNEGGSEDDKDDDKDKKDKKDK